jgi:hypothetical protein
LKKYIIIVSNTKITVLAFMLFCTLANAQTTPPPPPSPPDDSAVPIDNYVWVLAFLGLVYVYLRIIAYSKQESSESI